MMWIKTSAVIIGSVVIIGCDAPASSFRCGVPGGISCQSLDKVDAMVSKGQLPTSSMAGQPAKESPVTTSYPTTFKIVPGVPFKGAVRRIPEKSQKIVIGPYIDSMGDFHEKTVVHTVVRPATWAVQE